MTTNPSSYAVLLRFRDLVTEPGGNIAEHRKIIRQRGYAWWGWWARQRESIPRKTFAQLFQSDTSATEIILFDSGALQLYRTQASRIVVAPSHMGVNSPDFEATPDYYVRGRYPAWFRLEGDIITLETSTAQVVARPTISQDLDALDPSLHAERPLGLDALNDEKPTLWIITSTTAE